MKKGFLSIVGLLMMVALLIMPTSSAWWWTANPPNNHLCPQGKDPNGGIWIDGWAGGQLKDNAGSLIGTPNLFGVGTINIPMVVGQHCVWSVKYMIWANLSHILPPWCSENNMDVQLILGYYPNWPAGPWQQVDLDSMFVENDDPGVNVGSEGFLHVYDSDRDYQQGLEYHYTLNLNLWGEYFDPRFDEWVVGLTWGDIGSYKIS